MDVAIFPSLSLVLWDRSDLDLGFAASSPAFGSLEWPPQQTFRTQIILKV